MGKTVSFRVDGFNVYHSLRALAQASGASVKWLDLHRLCASYLHAVRSALGERVDLGDVRYFSALAHHLAERDPGVVQRHQTYLDALRGSGVSITLSQFKRKEVRCPKCDSRFPRYEEKETDVAIAAQLLEVAATGASDTVVLVSGDTDLLPAIRSARRLRSGMRIGVAFPFLRHNAELASNADYHFKLNQKDIQKSQFPATVHLPDGGTAVRPRGW